ncbi:MAG: branched-chain amino acid transaminase [Chitinophagaceae bacterium]|nr:MAG: branched-chain amino acid transaminase [Chitinophagaceae bacterium]
MAAYYNNETLIYRDGAFVNAADAKMDLYSQSLHYGYSVFEGIRSYRTVNGDTRIFKATEHFERLKRSAAALNLPYHWTTEELIEATYEVLRRNNQQDAYIRPIVFAPANMSFSLNTESYIAIQTWEMSPFLGNKALRVSVSSFQRPNPRAFHIEAKAGGHYVNSILASQEAKSKGFDEALLTDMEGYAAEGPGANLFIEKDGELFTPSTGQILPGITRQTILDTCEELGIAVTEKKINLVELKNADTAFFCGTAAETVGFASIDDTVFPLKWEDSISSIIQQAYLAIVTEAGLDKVKAQLAQRTETLV